MILFNLKCAHDHRFEAWFANGGAYDRQAAAGEIECPHCGDRKISKAPMAPRIHTRRGHQDPRPRVPDETPAESPAESPGEQAAGEPVSLASSEEGKIWQALRDLRRAVVESYDDVGADFAEEARAIHDGTAEKRGIYGQATLEETRELLEDGVPVLPLPPDRKVS